jgi:hypothetical protein
MSSVSSEGPKNLAEAIDAIEAGYEFMLAYAAQGRRVEEDDGGMGIRHHLKQADAGLSLISAMTPQSVGGRSGDDVLAAFLDLVKADAVRARTAVRFVLTQRSIGSQMTDNLNASIHIRTLLTDLFLLDESLKISGP